MFLGGGGAELGPCQAALWPDMEALASVPAQRRVEPPSALCPYLGGRGQTEPPEAACQPRDAARLLLLTWVARQLWTGLPERRRVLLRAQP